MDFYGLILLANYLEQLSTKSRLILHSWLTTFTHPCQLTVAANKLCSF